MTDEQKAESNATQHEAPIDAWRARNPAARKVAFGWTLLTSVLAVFAFFESFFWAPARTAAQIRGQATREGWHHEPIVSIDTIFDSCEITNRDDRAILQVWLARDFFLIDLSEPCARSRSEGAFGWAHAEALEPGSRLVEKRGSDPGGPDLEEVATALASECPQAHDCLVVVECRGHYLRAADLRAYSRSSWAVLDRRLGSALEPARTLAHGTFGAGGARAEWKDDRHRSAFACVKEVLARDAAREERLTVAEEGIRALLPR